VGNDPVNAVDPSGMLLVPIYGRACAGTAGYEVCEWYVVGYLETGGGFGGGITGGPGGWIEPLGGSGGGNEPTGSQGAVGQGPMMYPENWLSRAFGENSLDFLTKPPSASTSRGVQDTRQQ
jgi:hypothetical protein